MWKHGCAEYMDVDTWMNTWMKHMYVIRHIDEYIDETHSYGDMSGMKTVAMESWP